MKAKVKLELQSRKRELNDREILPVYIRFMKGLEGHVFVVRVQTIIDNNCNAKV